MVKFQIPLNKEHFIAIGNITAYFTLLDYYLSICIWRLIGSEQKMGRIITTDLSFAQKVVLFRALYIYRNDSNEKLVKLRKLVIRLKQAEEKRNSITHSIWLASKNLRTITRTKATIKKKTGLEHTFEDMSAEDLKKITESFGELAHELVVFLE